MNKYFDCEANEIITEKQLEKEFQQLKKENPLEYDYDFTDYIKNCTAKNGTLTPIQPKEKRHEKA